MRPALILAAVLAVTAGLLTVLTGCVITNNEATDTEGARL